MRVSAVEYMAKKASENFKLKDVKFDGFEKINIEEENKVIDDQEDYEVYMEIWANLSVKYDGNPPESYRVLNKIIQDWVDDNESEIKKIVNPKLISFLKDSYKDIDVSDLNQDFDDYIWEDQVDYMPDIDEKNNNISFVIELVLEVDEEDKED
jgi:hypothetical protein